MAEFRKFRIRCLIIFLSFCTIACADILLDSAIRKSNDHQISMKQDLVALQSKKFSKRSLRHQITKRDTANGAVGDSVCRDIEEKRYRNDLKSVQGFANSFTFDNETKFTMSLAWAGENTGKILVVTTEEHFIFAMPSNIYQSINFGKTFTKINAKIFNNYIRKDNGLQKHPRKPEKVFIIAHSDNGNNNEIYITENGGDSFVRYNLDFILDDSILFHPSKDEYMLTKSKQTADLWLSKDGGKNWIKIKSGVIHVKWSTKEPETIFTTIDVNHKNNDIFSMLQEHHYELHRTTECSVTSCKWTTLHKNVFTFGSEGKFLYVSILKSDGSDDRIMKVSTDDGNTWDDTQLPSITSERFYSILDMSEGLVFMHVDNPEDTGHGTLYTSDAAGIIFSESLQRHLYPNYVDLTDFYKVKSMRGVYIASQLMEDNSIRTMISYDRGGEWNPISRPRGAPCKDESKPCYLQIHNMYSISRGVTAKPPLSSENAVGIIMVHGHVAESLQTTNPNVYISDDGGYSWFKALDGPHHYQIADHGGLLVAVPADTSTPKVVKFSTDNGRCWHSYQFTTKDLFFTGLLTEPGSKAMSIGLWGFRQSDRVWESHVIDFETIIDNQCDLATDYEDFSPHIGNNNGGCLLGVKETFSRIKVDSWCKNGYSYEKSKTTVKCQCSRADYSCDFGYYRKDGSENCIKDPDFTGGELDICYKGYEEEVITVGYRKIPGDQCDGGYQPKGRQVKTTDKKCSVLSVLEDEMDTDDNGNNKWYDKLPKINKSGAVLMGVVVLILLLTVVMLVYFVHKCNHLRRMKVSYRYSMINQGEHDEVEAALLSNSLYDDSDEDEGNSRSASIAQVPATSVQTSAPHRPVTYNATVSNGRPAFPASAMDSPQRAPQPKTKVKSYHDDSDVDMLE